MSCGAALAASSARLLGCPVREVSKLLPGSRRLGFPCRGGALSRLCVERCELGSRGSRGLVALAARRARERSWRVRLIVKFAMVLPSSKTRHMLKAAQAPQYHHTSRSERIRPVPLRLRHSEHVPSYCDHRCGTSRRARVQSSSSAAQQAINKRRTLRNTHASRRAACATDAQQKDHKKCCTSHALRRAAPPAVEAFACTVRSPGFWPLPKPSAQWQKQQHR